MPINVQDFIIEPPPIRESAGLTRLQDQLNVNKQFEYRKQKENEMDDWRKVNLIRELTDLSQYQTPDSAANKIGSDRANEILQKYTAGIKNMSPAELLANIQKDMQDTHIGMEAIKNEFAQAHAMAAELKKLSPELDAAALEMDLRKDITSRRLKGDAQFVPQMEVPPTQINLNDNKLLSRYMSGNKELSEAITNPKGLEDVGVASGNIVENIEYGGKIPAWKQPNFNEKDFQGGFLPRGFQPKLQVKEQPISTDILKGNDGKQLMGVTPEVYKSFSEGNKGLQLMQAARKKFKGYDDMSPEQQVAAESATLREMLDMDKTDFRFITSKRAPVSSTKNTFNLGSDADINKVYERMDAKINEDLAKGNTATRFNSLANDQQDVVKKAVLGAGYKEEDIGGSGENIFVRKDASGKIKVYRVTDEGELKVGPEHEITTLSYTGTNLGKQSGKAGKDETIRKGESGEAITPPPKQKSYSLKGKSYSYSDIEAAAKKSNMSVDDYIKKAGLK